jgi:hypothetical protein
MASCWMRGHMGHFWINIAKIEAPPRKNSQGSYSMQVRHAFLYRTKFCLPVLNWGSRGQFVELESICTEMCMGTPQTLRMENRMENLTRKNISNQKKKYFRQNWNCKKSSPYSSPYRDVEIKNCRMENVWRTCRLRDRPYGEPYGELFEISVWRTVWRTRLKKKNENSSWPFFTENWFFGKSFPYISPYRGVQSEKRRMENSWWTFRLLGSQGPLRASRGFLGTPRSS